MPRFHSYVLKFLPALMILATVVAITFAAIAVAAEIVSQANTPAGPKPAASAAPVQSTTTNTATVSKDSAEPPAKTDQQPVPPAVEEDNRDAEPISEDSGEVAVPLPGGQTSDGKVAATTARRAKAVVLDREGRRLIERTGHLERSGAQTRFIFDGDEKPLVVLPSHSLEMMEEISEYGKRPVTFTISAMICEYRGHNFLQLIGKPQLGSGPQPREADTEPAKATSGPTSAAKAVATSAAEPRNRTLPPEPTRQDIPPLAPVAPPVAKLPATSPEAAIESFTREGKHVVDQEGRIDRTGDHTRFIFDSGDPPILLLQNKKLEKMEDEGDYGRRPLRFRISGMVTEYRNQKYLSMTKLVVIPKFTEKL
jgi:hypothetical protein